MGEQELSIDTGLASIIAAQTKLSDVDGNGGKLTICGHSVGWLAANLGFEDMLAMLWAQGYPQASNASFIRQELAQHRVLAFKALPDLTRAHGSVEALRFALSSLPDGDDLDTALALVAMTGVATAAIARGVAGLEAIAPNPELGHCEDMLTMMHGRSPSPAEVNALAAYLVTVSDHGLNASTFAARVVASTQAGLTSAVVAGLSALKGPLHGGAPGPVLDMLDAIGIPENAEDWIDAAFARGDRLMGFGHRIYKVRDPRADALKLTLKTLPKNTGRLAFAEAIEATALTSLALRYPNRALETNVEYFTALLLEALHIPREVFTCVFASGRVLGWIAHANEQVATGRIVRPQSLYVGPIVQAAA